MVVGVLVALLSVIDFFNFPLSNKPTRALIYRVVRTQAMQKWMQTKKSRGAKNTRLSGSPTDRMLTARYFDENSETVRAPTTQPSLEFLGKHTAVGYQPTS